MQVIPLILAMISLLSGLNPDRAAAQRASEDEMRRACARWLALVAQGNDGWAGSNSPRILESRPVPEGNPEAARCFSIAPRGFVLVTPRWEMAPIRAYSTECNPDWSDPSGLAELLTHEFAGVLETRRQAHASSPAMSDRPGRGAAVARNQAAWRWLIEGAAGTGFGARTPVPATHGTVPLLTTRWHQVTPYWGACPLGCDGDTAVVGCVATAGAQILKYWRWPPHGGRGLETYSWNGEDDPYCQVPAPGQMLSADFSNPYDWDNMPDGWEGPFTAEQKAALAEIKFEAGVLFHMDYGAHESSANPSRMLLTWPAHLDFEDSMVDDRSSRYPTAEAWFEMLRDEINALRPMMYTLDRENHEVVCDGWQIAAGTNQIHLNYGGGGEPGMFWFALDDADPIAAEIVRHITPPRDGEATVRADGGGQYPTIQAAVDGVREGTTILLADGLFRGPGNRDIDFHGKRVTVASASGDPRTCILDCGGAAAEPHRGFIFHSGEESASVIRGLTIRHGRCRSRADSADTVGGAILCREGSSPLVVNCVLLANEASSGGALAVVGPGRPLLEHCVFAGNTAGEGGAVYLDQGADVLIRNSTLYANSGSVGGHLAVRGSSAVEVVQSILSFAPEGPSVASSLGGTVRLACTDVYGNAGGDWVDGIASQQGTDGNFSADPLFCRPEQGGFELSPGSPCGRAPCGVVGAAPMVTTCPEVDPTPPRPFALVSPADGESLDTIVPTLRWRSARNSDPDDTIRYAVFWSAEDSTFVQVDSTAVGQDTSYTIALPAPAVGHSYYWRVRAQDAGGCVRWSDPRAGRKIFFKSDGSLAGVTLQAQAVEDGIQLAWNVPPDLTVSGFRIHRRTPTLAWCCIASSAAGGSGPMTYTDTNADPGIRYQYLVEVSGPAGSQGFVGPVTGVAEAVARLRLSVDPNPGRDQLTVRFGLPRASRVALRLLRVDGREVARSELGTQRPGGHRVTWRPAGGGGRGLPSGIYWLRLETEAGWKATRWVVLR